MVEDERSSIAVLVGPPAPAAAPPRAPGVNVNDPKRRILLAGLLVGSCFMVAKMQRFLQ